VRRISVIVADPRSDLTRSERRFRAIKRRLLQRAYRRADRVVAVSEGVRRSAMAFYGLPPKQVVTIQNPIDLRLVDRLADEREAPLAPGRFHVVAAGRLQEEKGLIYLLQAARELVHRRGRKELAIHLLGQGPLENELKSFVARYALQAHVSFEGFQPNPFCFFRKAHLVCLPSVYEGMPNVLLEAIACGTPVLASDCESGPREVLADGRYGRLVPPRDFRALAHALEDAMTHYDAWLALVDDARAHVASRFALESRVSDLQGLLLEVCEFGGSGAPRSA
jgi:glycosyltransferase involved in cell wall biosynthesis